MQVLQKIAIWIIPLIFGITVHEVAHGWVAYKFGDSTAKRMGRITLNPIKHIDPIGTLLVPGVLLVLGNFIFGWAKPVPVNWQNLRNPRRDMALVALAGPASNFIMAMIWACIAKLTSFKILLSMCQAGIILNVVLMILNLLPVPPLDGSRVLSSLVSPKFAATLARIEPYGFFILVGLIATGVLGKIIWPPIQIVVKFILQTYGLL